MRSLPGVIAAGAALALAITAAPAVTPAAHAAGTVAPSVVINRDFPDPDIVTDGTTWHAYATSSPGIGPVPHATAPSPTGPWTVQGNVLDHKPGWARENHGLWAPDISRRADGSWLMYFTARHDANGRMCLGAATAASPDGPFVPTSETSPLVCDPAEGGAIDPSSFVDADENRYLLYKNDGNAVGKPAIIWLQQVAADGVTIIGERTELLRNSAPADQGVIEAPTLLERPDGFVLIFSAGVYTKGTYYTGYASAETLRGPYVRAERPLLTTESLDGAVNGPGGQDVVGDHIFFHGHLAAGGRGMYVADLGWSDGRPVVRGSRVRHEAEDGQRHLASVRSVADASDGQVVTGLDDPRAWVETTVYAPTAGTYTVHVGHTAAGPASHRVSVNGRHTRVVGYPGGAGGQEATVDVMLAAGENTVRLTRLRGSAEIDYLDVA